MLKYTERLGTAPLPSLLLRLSLPSIAGSITISLYNIIDTFWVATLGHEAIAALTIVFPYQILTIAIGIGTSTGISALVSRYFGEKKPEAANRAAGQIFFLSIFWGLFFLALAVLFSESILTAFGATEDIMVFSRTYLLVTSIGAPAHVFILLAANLIRGSGDAVKPAVIMITASVLNIILDPLLILGTGPFPALGIKGAATATVIAQYTGALIGLIYLLRKKTTFRISIRDIAPEASIIKNIYKVGAPASIQMITESLAFAILNKVVSGFGSIPIAAVGLALRISDLAFMPMIGLSHALLPVVGFNFGAGKFKRLWKAVKLSSFSIAALLLVFTVIIEIWAHGIIGIFIEDPEVMAVAIPTMRVMLSTLIFIGPSILFITAFQGLSMGGMALFLSLIRQFLLFVPSLFLLRHLMGLPGVWLSLPVSDFLSFFITLLFLYREYCKRKINYPEYS